MTKQGSVDSEAVLQTTSDGEAPVLELWGMQSTPSLPLLWPSGVVPDRVLSMSHIELAVSNIEQILEAASDKAAAVQPPKKPCGCVDSAIWMHYMDAN